MISTPLAVTNQPKFRGNNDSAQSERFRADLALRESRIPERLPSNDWFNRFDPFEGVSTDPQSLHKYTYAHNDPVNNTDPSGKFISALVSLGIGAFQQGRDLFKVEVGRQIRSALGYISVGSAAGIGIHAAFGGDLADGVLYGGQLGAGLYIAKFTNNWDDAIAGGMLEAFSSLLQETGVFRFLIGQSTRITGGLTPNPNFTPKPASQRILTIFQSFSTGVFQTARRGFLGGGTGSGAFDAVMLQLASDWFKDPRPTAHEMAANAVRAGGPTAIRSLIQENGEFETLASQIGADAAYTALLDYFIVALDTATPFFGSKLSGDTSRYQ